jgi:hypothetical protein
MVCVTVVALQLNGCPKALVAARASTASTINNLRKSAISFSLVKFEIELMKELCNLSLKCHLDPEWKQAFSR